MKAVDNVLKGVVPCYGAVKSGMKLVESQQQKSKSKKQKRYRLTEISQGSGKAVLCPGVNVNQAAKKLFDYEATGLSPYEICTLIERERNLTKRIEKLEGWENGS